MLLLLLLPLLLLVSELSFSKRVFSVRASERLSKDGKEKKSDL